MTFTTFLIIAGVLALCVGPVMMFQPSARDRRLAGLRTNAISQGMRVSLGSGQLAGSARYLRPWPEKRADRPFWRLQKKAFEHDLHLQSFWSVEQGDPPAAHRLALEKALADMPEGIIAMESAPDGLAVYWREQGEFDAVAQWLKTLAQSLDQAER